MSDVGPLCRQLVAGCDAGSVRAVLHAGCSSPGAIHHLPVIAEMLVQAYAHPPTGQRIAQPRDLGRWIAAIRIEAPWVTARDDFLPWDPRLLVRVPVQGVLRPVHPGWLRRPLDTLAALGDYAECVDTVLIAERGFGLADVLDIGARIMDAERAVVAPYWPADRPTDWRAGSTVSADEVAAVAGYLSTSWMEADPDVLPDLLWDAGGSSLTATERSQAAKALAWVTHDATAIAAGRDWLMRGALLIRHDDKTIPVPAGVVLDSLASATFTLLNQVASITKRSRKTSAAAGSPTPEPAAEYADLISRQVCESLRGLAAHAFTGATTKGGRDVTALVTAGRRHLVAIEVAASIDPAAMAKTINAAIKQVQRVQPSATIGLSITSEDTATWHGLVESLPFEKVPREPQTARMRAGVEVRHVVLVAGPWAPPTSRRAGVVTMAVDEWCDLVAESGDDQERFWAFLDELAELPGTRSVEAFELRDLWDAFCTAGVLYAGGRPVTGRLVPPRDNDTHWRDAADQDGIEEVLHTLGETPIRYWPLRSKAHDGIMALSRLTPVRHASVNATPPLFIGIDPGDGPAFAPGLAFTLAEAIRDGVTQVFSDSTTPQSDGSDTAAWTAWRDATGAAAHIELVASTNLDPSTPIRCVGVVESAILIAYDRANLVGIGTEDVHDLLGAALAQAVAIMIAMAGAPAGADSSIDPRQVLDAAPHASTAGDMFLAAWRSTEKTFRIGYRSTTVFPDPGGVGSSISIAARARAERQLAKAIYTAGIPAQTVTGASATDLLRTVICPMTFGLLMDDLTRFDPEALRDLACLETEHLWAERDRLQLHRAGRLASGWEPTEGDGSPLEETIACRAADLIIETITHRPPTGTIMPDHRDWERLLNHAALCVELASQTTAGAVGLHDIAVDIEENGRCRSATIGSAIDMGAYHHARLAQFERNQAQQLDDSTHTDEDTDTDEGADTEARPDTLIGLLERARTDRRRPSYEQPVAAAAIAAIHTMRQHLGTGPDEIAAVLSAGASWASRDPSGEYFDVDRDELIAAALESGSLDAAAIGTAIELLSLTPQRLETDGLAYWELERRDARLTTRPLLTVDSPDHPKRIRILPRRIDAAQNVLINYLRAGRLPWPKASLPPAVVRAFTDWQQKSRTAFEVYLECIAKDAGFRHYRRNLKPQKALKLNLVITGEIDLLLADDHQRLWVIEAKDAEVPFGLDQIFYEYAAYHGIPLDGAGQRRRGFSGPEDAYLGTLMKKVVDIQRQLDRTLEILEVSGGSAGWRVMPMFVTPQPVAAAFAADVTVPFVLASRLAQTLSNRDDPDPGFEKSP